MCKWREETDNSVCWGCGSPSFSETTEVIAGAVQDRPDDFNKDHKLNWWWSGWNDIDSMVDVARAYIKPGSLASIFGFAQGAARLLWQSLAQ